jgi:hypothetical protein
MTHKQGDKVLLKQDSEHYTGQYAGTFVTIKKIDSDLHFTALGFDGKTFICPSAYIEEIPELSWRKCECGAEKTYGKDCQKWLHSDYCPLYKPREE